jgi:hypothetical protein
MLETTSWRSVSEQKFGPTRDQFKAISADDQLLGWFFFGAKRRHLATAAYLEVYFRHRQKEIFGVGSLFSKYSGAAYLDIRCLDVRVREADAPGFVSLEATDRGDSNCKFTCAIHQVVDRKARVWSLTKLDASLHDSQKEVPKRWHKDYIAEARTESSEHIEIICPRCFGEGCYVSFAIPKEDHQKGLSGYDLFSCNKVNAEHACAQCGGTGINYHEWYLVENPHLRTEAPKFRRGSGTSSAMSMRPIQHLLPTLATSQ